MLWIFEEGGTVCGLRVDVSGKSDEGGGCELVYEVIESKIRDYQKRLGEICI